MLACDAPGQQQTADVRTGHSKYQQCEHTDHGSHAIHLRLEDLQMSSGRTLDELFIPNCFGVLFAQLIGESTKFLLGCFCSHTGTRGDPTYEYSNSSSPASTLLPSIR